VTAHAPHNKSVRSYSNVSVERLILWLAALEVRHLANLRVAEVTRALRALSSAYVQRRHKVASGSTLDSAGKRAAFALYYGPLHFIATAHVLQSLEATRPRHILDVGCGTGTVGAAWALHAGGTQVTGIDRHPWAVDETRLTYRDLGLPGRARLGDASRLPVTRGADVPDALVFGYVLNELPVETRTRVETHLLERAATGSSILILEPISKAIAPWWDRTAHAFAGVGGRVDEWKFQPEVPDIVALLGKGAGLNYRELRLRSIFVPGR
jgi:SAM-dependent methyltransferase